MTFTAQLTASTNVDYSTDFIGPTDFSLYGLWTFCRAFEDESSSDIPPETAVRSACLWYIYAADRLWANVKNCRVFGGPEAREKDPSSGYNRKRWDTWKEHLEAAQTAYTDEETKKLIQDALTHIKRVETGDLLV